LPAPLNYLTGGKAKEGENFNNRNTNKYFEDSAKGCALRLEKMHFVQNVEPGTGVGQKGAFFKDLDTAPEAHITNVV